MRQRAIQRGLRLNEYGLFKSKEETRDPKLLVPCRDEAEIFAKLDLPFVPPELREDHGEFAAGGEERLAQARRMDGFERRAAQPFDLERRPQSPGGNRRSTWKNSAWNTGPSPTIQNRRSRPMVWTRNVSGEQIKEIKKINGQLAGRGSDFRLLTGMRSGHFTRPAGFRRRAAGGTGSGGGESACAVQQRGGKHKTADSRGGKSISSTSSAIRPAGCCWSASRIRSTCRR